MKFPYVIVERNEYEKLLKENKKLRDQTINRYVYGCALASLVDVFWETFRKEFTDDGKVVRESVDYFLKMEDFDDI